MRGVFHNTGGFVNAAVVVRYIDGRQRDPSFCFSYVVRVLKEATSSMYLLM